jgi:hypothetical protein
MILAGIGDKLRRAFALVFDADDPHSAEIVRLEAASQYTNALGDSYSYNLALREVK